MKPFFAALHSKDSPWPGLLFTQTVLCKALRGYFPKLQLMVGPNIETVHSTVLYTLKRKGTRSRHIGELTAIAKTLETGACSKREFRDHGSSRVKALNPKPLKP